MLVMSASGAEQVGALPRLLERFPPAGILWAGPPQGTYAARELMAAVNRAGIPVTPAETGQTVDLGQGACLGVLHAGERGAVLLPEWRNFRLLLPAGDDIDTFQALENGQSIGQVNALLLADGGTPPPTRRGGAPRSTRS